MADSEPTLDAMFHELGEAVSRGMDEHPTREQLAAYCRGELGSDEREAVAAHLAWCSEDADFVLAFREISGLDPSDDEPAAALDSAWRAFQGLRASPPKPPRALRRRWGMPLALAASLLVAAVTGWLLATFMGPAGPAGPRSNAVIVDLGATDEERAAGPEVKEIVLRDDETSLTVILHPTRELAAQRFSVALLTKDDREVWHGDVRPQELGTFQLTFPREFLAAADYVLVLRGHDDGHVDVLDRFPVRIVKR